LQKEKINHFKNNTGGDEKQIEFNSTPFMRFYIETETSLSNPKEIKQLAGVGINSALECDQNLF